MGRLNPPGSVCRSRGELFAVLLTGWLAACLTPAFVTAQPAVQSDLSQFDQLLAGADYAAAERYAEARLKVYEQSSPGDRGSLFRWNWRLGLARLELGKYREAEPVLVKALQQATDLWPAGHVYATQQMLTLADLYVEQSRFAEAERLYTDALARRRRGLTVDARQQVQGLQLAVQQFEAQGQRQLADDLRRVLADVQTNPQRTTQINTADVAEALDRLANLYIEQARYGAAEPLLQEALELREHVWGPLQSSVAVSVDHLGHLAVLTGNYTSAEARFKQALEIRRKIHPAGAREVARALTRLGEFYLEVERLPDARGLLESALQTYEAGGWSRHPEIADCLFALARLHDRQGDYALADVLNRRSIEVRQAVFAPLHKSLAASYAAAGELYRRHGRLAEAQAALREALAIQEQVLGPTHPALADSLERLANVQAARGDWVAAQSLLERSLEARIQTVGPDHPHVARTLVSLAQTRVRQAAPSDALPLLERAERIQLAHLGEQHADLAATRAVRATIAAQSGQPEDALRWATRAVQTADAAAVSPGLRADLRQMQARIEWDAGKREAAVALLEEAVAFAEEQRLTALGSDYDRSALFDRSADVLELLIRWQMELGRTEAAFLASERARSRTLLEQLQQRGSDLLQTLPTAQRQTLERTYLARQTRAVSLQRQLDVLLADPALSEADRRRQIPPLQSKLAEARQKVVSGYRDIQTAVTASGARRSQTFEPISLQDFTNWAQRQQMAVLEFIPAEGQVYRLVIPPRGASRMTPLVVEADLAERLGLPPGPLDLARLQSAMRVRDQSVATWLGAPELPDDVAERLAALGELLIPDDWRQSMGDVGARQLLILSAGPLVRLPFEALIMEAHPERRYLLDVGPPTFYAPSATLARQLAERSPNRTALTTVVTLGDPRYPSGTNAADRSQPSRELELRGQFANRGGSLNPLPFAGVESRKIAELFQSRGASVASLTGAEATEGNFRRQAAGRQLVHFACHGLADEQFGNLFGSLALAPGTAATSNPADDGFLMLAEINDLDLTECELTILSACQSNLGPQQSGEGAWALSRGFLVAGARRVVASNWLVNDEATAQLVEQFCRPLAADRPAGEAPDYAAALQAARRAIRHDPRWSSPYYWAPFVLLGPG